MSGCPTQDRALQLPLLLRLQRPGVLRPQPGQLLRLAPARVTASGHGLGLVLADPRPQRLRGDAEISSHRRIRPLASRGAVVRDGVLPELLRIQRLALSGCPLQRISLS